MQAKNLRWLIVFLLFAATAISYIDRQVLTIIAPALRDQFGITNTGYASILSAFLFAYTFMQPVTGWMIDRIGTRLGFAIIMGWWSIAAALHAFGSSVASFGAFRLLLGMGEAGSWSACVKAVSEWFPRKDRGRATGFWSFGVSFGLVVSVPIVTWINVALGWRWAFILTGLTGIVWIVFWLWLYRRPETSPDIADAERPHIPQEPSIASSDVRVPVGKLLRSRKVWAVTSARFLADPWVWFYYFWIPEFLTRNMGFSAVEIGRYAWIPFVAQGVAILIGGALSDALHSRGMDLVRARLTVMGIGMLLMTAGLVAAFRVDIVVIFAGISCAMFGFGLWAPNMMSLCADVFPKSVVGSVVGLSGMGAGAGGILFTMLTGWVLDHYGFTPVFIAAGSIPLVAICVLLIGMKRRDEPLSAQGAY